MKKYLIPLFMVLVVIASSFVVLADDGTISGEERDEPRKDWYKLNWFEKTINHYMEDFGLTEESSIGDLLDAITGEKEEIETNGKEYFGVETNEELLDALRSQKIDRIRNYLELDEDLSDEEVLEIAKDTRRLEIIEILGLEEDVSDEEFMEAKAEWREENRPLLKSLRHRFRISKGIHLKL